MSERIQMDFEHVLLQDFYYIFYHYVFLGRFYVIVL